MGPTQSLRYSLREKLHEGQATIVYRASLEPDQRPVVVKVSRAARPGPRDLAKLRQEYEFARGLVEVAVQPIALIETAPAVALILEDFGGISLKEFLRSGGPDLAAFLRLACRLAGQLSAIHAAGIIHKDVNPNNILIHPQTQDSRFIDFGISARVNLKSQHLGNPDVLEGTLAYISPEQTGRMNRVLDYRSDLYSLGVTFYEILTGSLPFPAEDSMELVHCHMARTARPVHILNPRIPEMLSRIVARLMAKNAEERYQSADGLRLDLEECQKLLTDGDIPLFEPGSRDHSGVFQISQKLYGRVKQHAALMEAFERAAAGSLELMLVSGFSGVGKSALVNEVHKPITARRGNFIAGKYDQFQRNVPYFAIRQAFEDFAALLLIENPTAFGEWKERILEAVGTNGQVLLEVIPGLERVIGPQPPVSALSPQEAQNRFKLVFQNFVRAVSRTDHPLVIFIDDLQWADSASLNLLRTLLTDANNRYLLFIGAYRDNEVGPAHPFISMLQEVGRAGVVPRDITLPNLSQIDVGHLIGDALPATGREVSELTELVYHKTQGNAFFTREFLRDLYENEHLRFDAMSRQWLWDLNHIAALNLTDNVVELMTGKLTRLQTRTQEVAQLAACIGSKFDLNILAIINASDQPTTFQELWPAVREGLVLPLDEQYRLALNGVDLNEAGGEAPAFVPGPSLTPEGASQSTRAGAIFRFAHDRVQQAAYGLIPEHLRREIHLRVGRLLLANTTAAEMEDRLFDIVNQFNKGLELIEIEEKLRVIELNLTAAEKAVKSSAFSAALVYVAAALRLFDDNAWETQHALAYRAYRLKASCEYSSNQHEQCAATVKGILPRCVGEEEKVKIYTIQLNNLFTLNRHHEALKVILESAEFLGVRIPPKTRKYHLALEYLKFRLTLGRRKPADLVDLPEMTDHHMVRVCEILYNSVESTYMVAPDMMGWISIHMARICLNFGNSEISGSAYAMVALVVEGVLKQFGFAWEFSQLAIRLNEKFPHVDSKARNYFLAGNFTLHWVRPVEEHLPYIRTSLECANESGNVHWGNYAIAFSRTQSIFFNRASLEEIETENANYYEFHAKSDREVTLNQYMLLEHIAGLRGTRNGVKNIFNYEVSTYSEEMNTPGNFLIREYFFTIRCIEAYHRGDFSDALRWAWRGFVIELEILGVMLDYLSRFYYQLSYLAGRKTVTLGQRAKLLVGYRINKFLMRRYAKSAPENFQAHELILQAEEARARGRRELAESLYVAATRTAETIGFPHIIALANELAGRFFLEGPDPRGRAGQYLRAAQVAYLDWGAHSRAEELAARYPGFLRSTLGPDSFTPGLDPAVSQEHGHPVGHDAETETESENTSGTGTLDFISVIKASQAISGEIRMEALLENLMTIVIENAGAERGVLLLDRNGKLSLEAEGHVDPTRRKILESTELESDEFLPSAVARYVHRTGESIVLGDATREGMFTHAPYVVRQQPRSVLCMPITRQGRTIGVIYLENNLIPNAFTPARIEVLRILGSQAAISLENARLVAAYGRFVPREFLQLLGKESAIDVQLGDQVQREMTVLFSDLRSFTEMSERMTPRENFEFLNGLLRRVGPLVRRHKGFIDKYIGDAIMALFPENPGDALDMAIAMNRELIKVNAARATAGMGAIRLGTGINTGSLILGTIGEERRMEGTVISDAVNLASRMEGLSKTFDARIICTTDTLYRVPDPTRYLFRILGQVAVKGKKKPVTVYDIFDGDDEDRRLLKLNTRGDFERGIQEFFAHNFSTGAGFFENVLAVHPADQAADLYYKRARHYEQHGLPPEFDEEQSLI